MLHISGEYHSLELKKRWKKFVDQNVENPRIRPVILESWKRCINYRLNPKYADIPIRLSSVEAKQYLFESSLDIAINPLINMLKHIAQESNHIVVISDGEGNIVYRDGSPSMLLKAEEEVHCTLGALWSEQTAGTNALGTCLTIGKPVSVFGEEHFCETVHGWTCSAAPIREPYTNKILGAIDLTGYKENFHPHTLAAVIALSQTIRECLKNRLDYERFLLLEVFTERMVKHSNTPLIVVDRYNQVIKCSPTLKGISEHLEILPEDKKEHSWKVEGPDGTWTLAYMPYHYEGRFIGGIIQAEPPQKRSNVFQRTRYSFRSFVGTDPKFKEAIRRAEQFTHTEFPVLILGESGTGKELFAQSIHASSPRSRGPFVAINCSAIPKELAVSELFGFVGGSFTGASKEGRPGKFEQANGGTIFLDEIGDMPLELQAMLLRVLEEKEVIPIGGKMPRPVDVRVIAATNKNLFNLVHEGRFREDLYYRLNVLTLDLPPLRNRKRDIPLLWEHFLNEACTNVKRRLPLVEEEVLHWLSSYHWPGNIRELRNLTYYLATVVQKDKITLDDLPPYIKSPTRTDINKPLKVQQVSIIKSALKQNNGNITKTARQLGISRATIYRKIKNLKKEYEHFPPNG